MGFWWVFLRLLADAAVTPEQVLSHLQAQYPGQVVLYAAELAKVLGKTEKALAHLISRDRLPFELKSLGGRKCVDIFQLADWLATGGQEGVSPEQTGAVRPKGAGRGAQSAGERKPRGAKSSIGARLMEMRHQAATVARRLAASCVDPQEAAFLVELAEGFLTQPGLPVSAWSFSFVRWTESSGVQLRQETKGFAESREDLGYVLSCLQDDAAGAARATLVVRYESRHVRRAYYLDGVGWTVVLNRA